MVKEAVNGRVKKNAADFESTKIRDLEVWPLGDDMAVVLIPGMGYIVTAPDWHGDRPTGVPRGSLCVTAYENGQPVDVLFPSVKL